MGGTGNDNLIQVKVVALPQAGTGSLKWNGEDLGVGTVISLPSLNAGHLVYQPEANGHGNNFATASFLLGNAGIFNNTPMPVTFTVLPVNDNPIAQNGKAVLLEDLSALLGLLDLSGSSATPDLSDPTALTAGINMSTLQVAGQLHATDVDGDVLTFTIVNQPAFGTVVLDAATGAYTYTPSAAFVLDDTFTFKVNDGTTLSNPGTVTIQFLADDILSPAADPGGLDTSGLGDLLDLIDGVDAGLLNDGVTSPRMVTIPAAASSQEETDSLHETGTVATDLTFDFGAPMEKSAPETANQSGESTATEVQSFDFFAPNTGVLSAEAGNSVAHSALSSATVSLTWDNAFTPTGSTDATVLPGETGNTSLPTEMFIPIPEEENASPAWHLDAQSVSLG